jgi:hypothetical protein
MLVILTLLVYIYVDKALYLKYSEYKVPNYSVAGREDSEDTYLIDVNTILDTLDSEQGNIFTPITVSGNDDVQPSSLPVTFSWKQSDYIKIANALSRYVWGESLDNWNLEFAKFLISRVGNSFRIEYVLFTFFKRENDKYIIHEITIDARHGKVVTGENIYHDAEKWKSLDFDELTISDVSQVISVAEANGGESVCLALKNKCSIAVWLNSNLYEYKRFLWLPIYRYESRWIVGYYDENGKPIFDATIDPYSGTYKINK